MFFKISLVLSFLGVSFYGLNFYKKQNKLGHLGGNISLPKCFWLTYTIYSWFFLPIFLAIKVEQDPIRHTIIGYLLLFWVRGIAELLMLYKWKNWRPPYGISHDIICLAFLLFMQIRHTSEWNFAFEGMPGLAMSWVHVTTFCMMIEIYYAFKFFELVKGKTVGDDGVWFADQEDPVYKRINLVTTIFNWPLYMHALWLTFMLLQD